jgi:hypothetical protein
MSDRSLRLQVIFGALDKLSAPIQRMRAGSKGLAKDMAATRKEIAGLKAASAEVRRLEQLRGKLGDTQSELVKVRLRMQQVRAEIAKSDAPSKDLTRSLAAMEREERKLVTTTGKQATELAQLQGALEAAGVDTSNLSRHQSELGRRMDAANRRLGDQHKRMERLNRVRERGEKIQKVGKGIATAGVASTAVVSAPLLLFGKQAADAAQESRAASAQVEASLASMGKASKRSIGQLQEQAAKLQRTSLFDDDDIMVQLTANLLTFGNVSGKVFDRAQQGAVNMSAKLGQSLQSSAMQLGKALNDPVKGVTALQRVGVSFTAEQKKMIAQMVKAKDVAGAQNLILGELEKQFAGSAQAARNAKPGAATIDDWREFQETAGEIILKTLPKLTQVLDRVIVAFNTMSPGMQTFMIGLGAVAIILGPILTLLGGLITVIGAVSTALAAGAAAIGIGMLPMIGIVLAVIAVVALLAYAAYKIYQNWGPIKGWFIGLWESIKGAFSAVVAWFGQAFQSLKTFFVANWQYMVAAVAPFMAIPLLIYNNWGAIAGFFAGLWGRIRSLFATAPGQLWQAFKGGFMAGLNWLVNLHVRFAEIGANLVAGLIRGFFGKVGALKNAIVNVAGNVKNWFAQKLGIRSPSRVFMGLGGFLTEGLAIGVDRGSGAPVDRIRKLARSMGAAMTLGAAAPALAMPSASTATIGSLAGAGASRPAASAGAGGAPGGSVYNITINQQPGQSAEDLALMIRRAIEAHEREKAAAAMSRYEDD